METALIYGRVSSKGKQGDNFSIPTQLKLMREALTVQDYAIIEMADMDSAFNDGLERPKLQEALQLAREGKIKIFMFFSSDRFTRDIGDGVILRRELKRHGVKLFCYYPTITEITSEMELFHILNDWKSQQQVEIQRDKSIASLTSKAQAGLYPQGLIAYGYRIEGRRHNTVVVICEDEARVIRKIYQWYIRENIGCSEIARKLMAEHTPTPGGKTIWTERMVRKILTHAPMYAGIWYAKSQKRLSKSKVIRRPMDERIPIHVPEIISWNDRDAALQKLATRRAGREPYHTYLMACRSDCTCGRKNTGQAFKNGKTPILYKYYRCLSSRNHEGPCGRNQFPSENVDETVWQFAIELIQDPQRLLEGWRELKRETEHEQTELERRIATLDEEIAQLKGKIETIIESATNSTARSLKDVLNERAETLGKALDELIARREALAAQLDTEMITDEDIASFVSEIEALRAMYEALHAIDEEADFEAKRALIEILNLRATLRITEAGEYWVDIHWLSKTYPKPLYVQKTKSPRNRGHP